MISERVIKFLKSVILPLALYLLLFNPLFSEQDQHITITINSAFLSLGIALCQLALFIFVMAKVNRLSLADTGLFSFSYKTMLKLIPSMLIIWGIYFAGILMLLLATGSAEDPAIITLVLDAPNLPGGDHGNSVWKKSCHNNKCCFFCSGTPLSGIPGCLRHLLPGTWVPMDILKIQEHTCECYNPCYV